MKTIIENNTNYPLDVRWFEILKRNKKIAFKIVINEEKNVLEKEK